MRNRWSLKKTGIILAVVTAIIGCFLLPAFFMRLQDKREMNQIAYKDVAAVSLNESERLSLEDKLRMFSGTNESTKFVFLSKEMEQREEGAKDTDEVWEIGDTKLERLVELGVLEFDAVNYSIVDDYQTIYVFDMDKPINSFLVWSCSFADTNGNLCTLNIDKDTHMVLGYSLTNYEYAGTWNLVYSEEQKEAYAKYLGVKYAGTEVEMEDFDETLERWGYTKDDIKSGNIQEESVASVMIERIGNRTLTFLYNEEKISYRFLDYGAGYSVGLQIDYY